MRGLQLGSIDMQQQDYSAIAGSCRYHLAAGLQCNCSQAGKQQPPVNWFWPTSSLVRCEEAWRGLSGPEKLQWAAIMSYLS